jgi:glycosyltransferase involved in cell wall biosynthesis
MSVLGSEKLVIFSDDTLYYDTNTNFKAANPITKLYGELNKWFSEVVLSSPASCVRSGMEGYCEKRITCSPRPYYSSVVGFFRTFPFIITATLKNIYMNVKRADVVMIRLPSPIGIIAYLLAKRCSKPCFLFIAGDIRKVAREGEKYRICLARFLSLSMANVFHLLTRIMVQNSLVFVAGSDLYRQFGPIAKHCVNFIPSIVSKEDIRLRQDTCHNEPHQLLYVGRLVPVKGLQYLLRAVKILLESETEVELQIVGDGCEKPRLEEFASGLGITDQIHFRGRVAFGPELSDIYMSADIFVLPSLSEGLPKTLLEAMAFGLPVIATKVGGVTAVIRDSGAGILVEPHSSEAIASAVEQLVSNARMRKEIVLKGYKFAREHTIEKQAMLMVEMIQRHVVREAN